MASSQSSNTARATQKGPVPGAALKRLAAHLYRFLKPKTCRSNSEHLLFTKVISIMELINKTEMTALLSTRETRAKKGPPTPTSTDIADFKRMRDLLFNRSPQYLTNMEVAVRPMMEMTTVQDRASTSPPERKSMTDNDTTTPVRPSTEYLDEVYNSLISEMQLE